MAQEPEYTALIDWLVRFRDGLLEGRPSDRTLAEAAQVSPTTIGNWLRKGQFPQEIDPLLRLVRAVRGWAENAGLTSRPEVAALLDEQQWWRACLAEARRRADGIRGAVEAGHGRAVLERMRPELTKARTVSGDPVCEARRIPARRRTPNPAPPAAATAASPGQGAYAAVRRTARGERKDYACPREPVPDGGQADVFEAVHKPTGTTVALKKLHSKYPAERQVARMRREIEIGQLLNGHPHAMPVLDFGADHTWFVVPWADATAAERQEVLQEPAELRALVDALASVLAAAHEHGWLHRDIKPSNIFYFDGRWTLADWGIVRRPRGQTTKVGRTGLYIGA